MHLCVQVCGYASVYAHLILTDMKVSGFLGCLAVPKLFDPQYCLLYMGMQVSAQEFLSGGYAVCCIRMLVYYIRMYISDVHM